jgi:hypothetical protein
VHDDDLFEENGVTGFGTPKFKLRTDLLRCAHCFWTSRSR